MQSVGAYRHTTVCRANYYRSHTHIYTPGVAQLQAGAGAGPPLFFVTLSPFPPPSLSFPSPPSTSPHAPSLPLTLSLLIRISCARFSGRSPDRPSCAVWSDACTKMRLSACSCRGGGGREQTRRPGFNKTSQDSGKTGLGFRQDRPGVQARQAWGSGKAGLGFRQGRPGVQARQAWGSSKAGLGFRLGKGGQHLSAVSDCPSSGAELHLHSVCTER